jgi:type IV secretion system protein VirB1
MNASILMPLVLRCAPQVHPVTAHALVQTESGSNPWAIGVVGGQLERQPQHRAQALATARALRDSGRNFSVGLAQINVGNFRRLGLSLELAFDPCANLGAMQAVLLECFERAQGSGSTDGRPPRTSNTRSLRPAEQHRLQQALSCYYSGNFSTGFQHGYVRRVQARVAPDGFRPRPPIGFAHPSLPTPPQPKEPS